MLVDDFLKFNLAKFFGAQDMTQGNPYTNLIQFAAPLLVGNLVQQLYGTVDSIVVGQYVGDNALAAVNATGPIVNLLLVLFMGISVGAGIMVSQYFGAKDREMLSKTVGNAMTLTFISSLIIMVLGLVVSRPMLELLGTPEEIIDWSASYMMIYFSGFLGCAFYNMISGILRGMGDAIMPLVFLIVACLLNIILDIVFVAALGLGVAGVAWATILAQFISCILCVIRLLKMKDTVDVNKQTLALSKDVSMRVIKLGLPSGMTQMIFSLAAVVVQSLTNSFGTMAMTCATVVMRVDGFVMMPNFSFGSAMTTYAGQNIGAGDVKRVDKGTKAGLKLGLSVSVVLCILILIFGKYLMQLFTNTHELIEMAMNMMRIIAVGYVGMAVTQILSGVMRGAGDTMTPMWISIVTTVIIRVPTAYILAFLSRTPELPTGSPYSLFWSLLISWVSGAVLTSIFFKKGAWRKKGITAKANKAEEAPEA